MRRPMAFIASRHSTSAKSFLGVNVPAGSTDGPARVEDGARYPVQSRERRAVLRAPDDPAARDQQSIAGVRGPRRGRVREQRLGRARRPEGGVDRDPDRRRGARLRPPARCRANCASRSGGSAVGAHLGRRVAQRLWNIAISPTRRPALGQSPLRSPSVFNFFRPGYVPPNTAIAAPGLVAPEFQLANETTPVAYINLMQTLIAERPHRRGPDYTALLPMRTMRAAVVAWLNSCWLTANWVRAAAAPSSTRSARSRARPTPASSSMLATALSRHDRARIPGAEMRRP